ncbi:restin homolog isoform X1 [Argiope bruennichi]|uniref:restin homolog isoform X1 n=1 Tax=Argiope bruennichi TaxID=94029 RepID=UPI002494CE7C|nr:restin homolog isoform X1 [Argiope bruennichi]
MNFGENVKNNLWAKYLGINSENIDNFLALPAEIDPEEKKDTKLPVVDIELYGSCPRYAEIHLVRCKTCHAILLPPALLKHIEKRHGTKEEITSKPSSSCSNASSSRTCYVTTTPSRNKETTWKMSKDTSCGAVLPSSVNVNTSANIVRVKSQKPNLKVETAPYHKHSKSRLLTLKKNNIEPELSVMKLPAVTSNIPSASILQHTSNSSLWNDFSPSVENKFGKDSVQSPQSNSTSSITPDSPDSPLAGKEAPLIQKLVLRRVLQTNEDPAVRRQSAEGTKGMARNKKDATKQPYFMVVKNKEHCQNLMATQQNMRMQPSVGHQETNKVEQKTRHLENIRDKLITKLLRELQYVKQKLNESNSTNTELRKEILVCKEQAEIGNSKEEENKRLKQEVEELKMTAEENKMLAEQNKRYMEEIQRLKAQVEFFTNSLLEHAQMYSNYANRSYNSEKLVQQLQIVEEQKLQYQRRLEEMENELREFKNSAQIEKETVDNKLQKFALLFAEMQEKFRLIKAQNKNLHVHNKLLENHLPQEALYEVESQYAAYSRQTELYELYPEMITNPTDIEEPSVPITEKLISDIQNNYLNYQQQEEDDSDEIFQQTMNEDIS